MGTVNGQKEQNRIQIQNVWQSHDHQISETTWHIKDEEHEKSQPA